MKKIKKNVAASWCCEASTVVDVRKLVTEEKRCIAEDEEKGNKKK